MIGVDDQPSCADLRVGEDLLVVVDRPARQTVRLEERESSGCADAESSPLRSAPASGSRFLTRAASLAYSRIVRPLGPLEQLAQSPEQAVVRRGERDVPVGAADRLIRRAHPVRGPHRLRNRCPPKYSVASHTDSATPASTSDVSMYWPCPVRVRW